MAEFLATGLFVFIGAGSVVTVTGVLQRSPLNDPAALAAIALAIILVFAAAMDPRGLAKLAPVAIGLAVLVDHLIGVPLTGASMNPARSFGPASIANFWDNHWIYWVGPLIGAGLSYTFLYMPQRKPDEC